MPGADCDSDHVPVMCKLQVKLKKIKKPKAHSKFQVEQLKSDQEIKEQFSIDIKNKFALLDSITEAETIWANIKDSINEVMETRIPKKAKKEHKKWMNKEILELMEERRKSKSDQVKYKMLNKEVKKKCNEAKKKK